MEKVTVSTMHPVEAIQLALHQYDVSPKTEKHKLLLDNVNVELTVSTPLPKHFKDSKLVDLNLGELLSLGVVGVYYSELEKPKATNYAVMIGIDADSKKAYEEYVLSDGAIFERGKDGRMPFQQVLVQGYFPSPRQISSDSIIKAIKKKTDIRNNYPRICGLILNVYGEAGDINFRYILDNSDTEKFDTALCIIYQLPSLAHCTIFSLDPAMTPEEFSINSRVIKLSRRAVS